MTKELMEGYDITETKAQCESKVFILRHVEYTEFANCDFRQQGYIYDLFMRLFPNLKKFSLAQRIRTIEAFQEIQVEADHLLEKEGTRPNFVYLLLHGELTLFKQVESVYLDDGKRVEVGVVPLLENPSD